MTHRCRESLYCDACEHYGASLKPPFYHPDEPDWDDITYEPEEEEETDETD
jgi:hypothetical protein